MHPASDDNQPSDAPSPRSLLLIATVGYGLFAAVITGVGMLPGLLDPTLSGNAGIGRFVILLGLAILLGAGIGAVTAITTDRNESVYTMPQ